MSKNRETNDKLSTKLEGKRKRLIFRVDFQKFHGKNHNNQRYPAKKIIQKSQNIKIRCLSTVFP